MRHAFINLFELFMGFIVQFCNKKKSLKNPKYKNSEKKCTRMTKPIWQNFQNFPQLPSVVWSDPLISIYFIECISRWKNKCFQFYSTKRRQNETEIIEMDRSLLHLFVSHVIIAKWMWKHIKNTIEKDQISECLRQMMIKIEWIETQHALKASWIVDEVFCGWKSKRKFEFALKRFAWLPRISRCFELYELKYKSKLSQSCFHFLNSSHQYSITGFLSTAMPATEIT